LGKKGLVSKRGNKGAFLFGGRARKEGETRLPLKKGPATLLKLTKLWGGGS